MEKIPSNGGIFSGNEWGEKMPEKQFQRWTRQSGASLPFITYTLSLGVFSATVPTMLTTIKRTCIGLTGLHHPQFDTVSETAAEVKNLVQGRNAWWCVLPRYLPIADAISRTLVFSFLQAVRWEETRPDIKVLYCVCSRVSGRFSPGKILR